MRALSPLSQSIRFNFEEKLGKYPHKVEAALRGDLESALSVVYLDVNTDICNHNCTFCDGFYRPLDQAVISTERILELIDEMEELGVLAVVLAGDRGEPLMHPGIARVLDRFARSPIQLGMYTNGSILPPKLVKPVGSMAWVRVSADAGTAETHRKMHAYTHQRDDFAKLRETLRALSGTVPDLGVSFILDPLNVHEIAQGADVLLGAGAHFIEYKPKYLPNYTVDTEFLIDHAEIIEESITAAQQNWGPRVVLNNQISGLLDGQGEPRLERDPRPCLTSALRMVVSSHGCYSCTPYRGESERRFGDVLTQSLRTILRGPRRVALIGRPCTRRCAYDAQNDFLIDLATTGRTLSVNVESARPQDAFI